VKALSTLDASNAEVSTSDKSAYSLEEVAISSSRSKYLQRVQTAALVPERLRGDERDRFCYRQGQRQSSHQRDPAVQTATFLLQQRTLSGQ